MTRTPRVAFVGNSEGRQLALLIVLVTIVYAATAARWLLGGDNGEFVTVAFGGGVPHPSGYPLYGLYLRMLHWLPGVSPAHTCALATTLLGVAGVVVVRRACVVWGATHEGATLAAATYAFSRLPWLMATHAEVFALHALLGASIVAVSAPHAAPRGRTRLLLLGLLAGLGLSNNHSLVLLAPLGIFGVFQGIREAARDRQADGVRHAALKEGAVGLAIAIAAALAGLLPYATLPAQLDGAFVWGDVSTFDGLLHHFLRADYGTTSLGITEGDTSAIQHIGALVFTFCDQLHWVFVGVLGVGLVRLWIASAGPGGRASVIALWLALFCAGPLFVAQFNLPLEGLAVKIVERFHLLPFVVSMVPLAIGYDTFLDGRLRRDGWATPLAILVACISLFRFFDDVREHHASHLEHYLRNTLKSVPDGGALIGVGDHELYGFTYLQQIEELRTDVLVLNAPMLNAGWYRSAAVRESGGGLRGLEPGRVVVPQLIEGLLDDGREVALTSVFHPSIAERFALLPVGSTLRVAPPGAPMPSPDQLEELNDSLFRQYTFPAAAPWSAESWGGFVYRFYAEPWRSLANVFDARGLPGDAEAAARCRARAVALTPWTSPDAPSAR